MIERVIHWLERRLGHLAIPHLIRGVVILTAVVFLLQLFAPEYRIQLLLDSDAIRSGQYWRIITWVFVPPATHWIFIFFALMFYWSIGEALEEAWGAFRLNLYFLVGMIGTLIGAFIFPRFDVSGNYLNLSLFFGFATLFPRYTILFFFIPMQVRWLALLSAALVGFSFFTASLPEKIAILVALSNYLLFFGPAFVAGFQHKREVQQRRAQFEQQKLPSTEAFHCCVVCNRTENAPEHLSFRVAADDQEYCEEHLPKAP